MIYKLDDFDLEKENKPKLLLHSCCGPCSTSVIKRLIDYFDVTVLFYNPNIDTRLEFNKRLLAQQTVINHYNVNLITVDYNHNQYLEFVKGLEKEKEGGARCEKCFELRLNKTFEVAKEEGFDYVTTTLSVSPHKNSKLINEIGFRLSEQYGIGFVESDFKKKDGFLLSTKLSKELNLYRQNYCGCEFAKDHLM